jgi:hypothetical protein
MMDQRKREHDDMVDMLQGIATKSGSTFALIDNAGGVEEHQMDGKSVGDQLRDKEMDQMSELLLKSAILSGSAFGMIERQVKINRLIVEYGGDVRRIPQSELKEIVEEQETILSNAHEVQRRLGMEE